MKRRKFITDTSKAILGGFIGSSVLVNTPIALKEIVPNIGTLHDSLRVYEPIKGMFKFNCGTKFTEFNWYKRLNPGDSFIAIERPCMGKFNPREDIHNNIITKSECKPYSTVYWSIPPDEGAVVYSEYDNVIYRFINNEWVTFCI